MSLTNEAAYLYVHGKELMSLTKKLRRLKQKAQKYVLKHHQVSSAEQKQKYKHKHQKVISKMKELFKKRNEVLQKIRQHHTAFAHQMLKELRR